MQTYSKIGQSILFILISLLFSVSNLSAVVAPAVVTTSCNPPLAALSASVVADGNTITSLPDITTASGLSALALGASDGCGCLNQTAPVVADIEAIEAVVAEVQNINKDSGLKDISLDINSTLSAIVLLAALDSPAVLACDLPVEPAFVASCGLFPSELTSFENEKCDTNQTTNDTCNRTTHSSSGFNHDFIASYDSIDFAQNDSSLLAGLGVGSANLTEDNDINMTSGMISALGLGFSNDDNQETELTKYKYGNIKFNKSNHNIHFNPSSTYSNKGRKVMALNNIEFTAHDLNITFEEGDYYFNSLDFLGDNITIKPKGDVKFFVLHNFNFKAKSESSDEDKMFVFANGDVNITSPSDANNQLDMFIYTKSDAFINSDSNLSGGITAEGNVTITGSNFPFVYDSEGASSLGMEGCPVGITPKFGPFDAWDIFRGESDKNISTKIASKSFDLNISNEQLTGGAALQAETTIEYRLYDMNDFNITGWKTYVILASGNSRSQTQNYNISSAHKDVRMQFRFCAKYDESDNSYTIGTMTSSNDKICAEGFAEITDTYSHDNFAIRPKEFNSTISDVNFTASQMYSIEFSADDNDNNPTKEYNEIEDSTFVVDVNISNSERICSNPITNLYRSLSFKDGNSTKSEYSLKNVGDFNLTIREKEGSEFAKVDEDDQPHDSANSRFITPYTTQISIKPAKFIVTSSYTNGSSGFTYISNDNNISNNDITSKLTLDITAVDSSDVRLTNYSSECFAENGDINVTLHDDLLASLSHIDWYKRVENSSSSDSNGSIAINTTKVYEVDFDRTDFNNSTAKLRFGINFHRDASSPLNPFAVKIVDINATDYNGITGKDSNQDRNTSFFYGRAHTADQRFDSPESNVTTYYQVYCDGCDKVEFNTTIGEVSSDSLSWFINKLHSNADGNVSSYSHSNIITTDNSKDITNGKKSISVTSTKVPYKERVDTVSSSWLQSDPTDFLIEFYGAGEWVGQGKQGKTVDMNISKKQNRRLDW